MHPFGFLDTTLPIGSYTRKNEEVV